MPLIGHPMRIINLSIIIAASVWSMVLANQSSASTQQAANDDRMIQIKKIYLVNESGGPQTFDRLRREFSKWRRFEIVASRENADALVVLNISQLDLVRRAGKTAGPRSREHDKLTLKLLEARTNALLWSDSQTVHWSNSRVIASMVHRLKEQIDKRIIKSP
ncbi:MAG TPA: hypothetical protein VGL91_00365 [Acidobacteriota bacterium]